MIRLYVASKKLVEAEKEICIKLVFPTEENNIWIALQKTEMESLDDCEISDIECDVKEADEFLKKLVYWSSFFATLCSKKYLTKSNFHWC